MSPRGEKKGRESKITLKEVESQKSDEHRRQRMEIYGGRKGGKAEKS